jgi:ABC-2 type transport system permease protein
MSAVGGSMVPRFLMPDLLQQASWLFPTAWAIEAYNSLLWRDASLGEIALPVGLLSGLSLASFLFAVLVMRRHVVR